MKVVGKKDLTVGRNISTMFMIYVLVLLIFVIFLLQYNKHLIFWSTVLALSILVLERLVALIKFKTLQSDLITMHRDYIEIKQHKDIKRIKYRDIKSIDINKRQNKVFIVTTFTTPIFIKYLDNPLAVKKEILEYRDKYY